MTIWESILYGALQGATEFLPVSSSGHLLLLSMLLASEGYSLFFAVVLHLGTLLAVLIALRKDIFSLFGKQNRHLIPLLIIATLPTVAIAVVVKLFVKESLLNALLPIGFALSIVFLTLSHYFGKDRFSLGKPLPPIVTGIVQGVALLPGFSRSGATISTLTLLGIKREQAVRFSFLMAIPVIVGSLLVEGYEALQSPEEMLPILILLTGCAVSFVVGLFSIKLLLRLAKKNSFLPFAIYLLLPLVLSLVLL